MTKKDFGTSGGVRLTDAVIKKLAKEAEAGIDISRLRPRRGRPPIGTEAATVFQVRLEPELRDALDEQAKTEGTTASELARRILRHALISLRGTSASAPDQSEKRMG